MVTLSGTVETATVASRRLSGSADMKNPNMPIETLSRDKTQSRRHLAERFAVWKRVGPSKHPDLIAIGHVEAIHSPIANSTQVDRHDSGVSNLQPRLGGNGFTGHS